MIGLLRHASWAFAGHAVFAICHWGTLVAVARIGGPDALGQYALALAIVTPIMIFAGLQMRELQVADATARFAFADYFAVRLAGLLAAGVLLAAAALVGYAVETALVIIMTIIVRGFEGLGEVHYGLAQRHRRFDRVARSMAIKGVAGLVAFAATYYVARDLVAAIAALAATRGVIWWFVDRRLTAPLRPPALAGHAMARRRALAWQAVPLGIAILLSALSPNVPRYFLDAYGGSAALGLFVAMAHFVVAGRLIVTAPSQAAAPRMADLYAAGDQRGLTQLLLQLVALSAIPGIAGLVVAIAFGSALLDLLYGPAFAGAADVFPWIMLAGVVLFAQTPLGYALTATQRRKIQPVILGGALLVNVAICAIFVPGLGVLGAALAWLASAIVLIMISVVALADTCSTKMGRVLP